MDLPRPPIELVAEIMKRAPERPGFLPLVAEGYGSVGDTLSSIYSVSCPILWESEIEGFEYSLSGSCFLCRFHGRVFVVTAEHCIRGATGNELRFARNPVSENFLPIKMMHVASTDNPDSDHSDLALFEADMDKVSPEEWAALHLLELDHLTVGYRLLNSGTDLMIPGFPKKVNMVDYDATKIIEQRYIPSGVYDKPTTDAHVHFLSFRELDQVSAIDGMSGSPVIMMKGDGNFHYYSLAGMLIRGDPDTKIGRFVEAGMIVWSLERIMGLR